MADPRHLHRRAGEMASNVIALVRPDQLEHATPCTEWDVRALINHVVGGNLRFAAMVTGEPGPDGGEDVLGGDPLASFENSFGRLCEAFDRPGFLGQAFPTPLGEGPGALLVEMRVVELTIHTWDVAAVTGRARDLDPELVGFADRVLRSRPIPRGVGGPFAPEQLSAPGATDADRLAAFAGRVVPGSEHAPGYDLLAVRGVPGPGRKSGVGYALSDSCRPGGTGVCPCRRCSPATW
jgi:uncharacterized protein (TIGR03086 family)